MGTETTAQADVKPEQQPPTKQEPEEDLEASDSEDSESESRIERWHEVVDAVTSATKDAVSASPTYDKAKPEAFLMYWRQVFARLLDSVIADPKVPEQLTEPPSEEFHVNLFNEPDLMCCPCTHPDVEPNVVLKKDGGVTKGDLVKRLAEYLYGDPVPLVHVANQVYGSTDSDSGSTMDVDESRPQEAQTEGAYDEHVVIYTSDWMSAGGPQKERAVYGYPPRIWIYGCRLEEFKQKAQRDAAQEQVKEQEKEEVQEQTLQRKTSRL